MVWYPWLTPHYHNLIKQHHLSRVHHAFLLHSLEGNGAVQLIKKMAHMFLCQQPIDDEACGVCHGCQMMKAENHPDWLEIGVEKDKSTLGVDAIRQFIERIYLYSGHGGRKVYWFSAVDMLTDAAANALLKTLEEPPENCYFFLSTSNPAKLLPTIKSRCFYYYLPPPNEKQSIDWLTEHLTLSYDLSEIKTALRLSLNAPLSAERLLISECWEQRKRFIVEFIAALNKQDMSLLFSSFKCENHADLLFWLYSLLTDTYKYKMELTSYLVNRDSITLLQLLAEKVSLSHLIIMMKACLLLRDEINQSIAINSELLIIAQLLGWQKYLF